MDPGAEREMGFEGGGIMWEIWALSSMPALATAWAAATAAACCLLPLLELGLLCILEWRVSSSEREKRFVQPGNWQAWGFSPVWVRM